MRLVEFEVEGFRSIRSLKLTGLGPHAVFYGPNGAGKSNILAAVERFFSLLRAFWQERCALAPGVTVDVDGALRDEDVWNGGPTRDVSFRATLEFKTPKVEKAQVRSIQIAMEWRAGGRARSRVTFGEATVSLTDHTRIDMRDFYRQTFDIPRLDPREHPRYWPALELAMGQATMHPLLPIPALRGALGKSIPVDVTDPTERAVRLAMAGCFEEAVFVAYTSPDLELLDRLDRLRTLLSGPPLNRPPFRPVRDEARGVYAIQEILTTGGKARGVSLDLAGLGVQQIYAIIAAIVLSKAPIVTLEEPEAHLYERGTGLDLRHLLQRLVPEPVSQLFTATHSSLFDLDPGGYWDVAYTPETGTTATWNPNLVDLDRKHVYEPGGARHALLVALRDGEPDRVVARRPDGSPVTASAMVKLLVEDDAVAIEFLNDVTAAAVRAVSVRANRSA